LRGEKKKRGEPRRTVKGEEFPGTKSLMELRQRQDPKSGNGKRNWQTGGRAKNLCSAWGTHQREKSNPPNEKKRGGVQTRFPENKKMKKESGVHKKKRKERGTNFVRRRDETIEKKEKKLQNSGTQIKGAK